MPTFFYKAKTGPSAITQGVIEANNQGDALHKLSMKGYFPISVVMKEDNFVLEKETKKKFSLNFLKKVSIKDLADFTRSLADLLDSGVPLFRSVQILAEQCNNTALKLVLDDIQGSIRDGKTLHESLGKNPKVFSALYINMVKSGEIGGMLETVLNRLADFAEKEDETRSKIKSAMAYPMLMLSVGVLSITVLMTFVIPRLVQLFSDMGQALPLPTQILIMISSALNNYWWLILIVSLTLFYIFQKWKKSEDGGRIYDRIKLKVPIIKDLILKEEIARFGRTLSTLLNNGVPIIQSLSIIKDTIKNKVIRDEIAMAADEISKGAKLGECLKKCGNFPPLFVNMVAVGEESGHVEKSLEKVAESYDKQVDRTIKTFTTILEPLMIVVLGSILGAIVISMILPIFDLSNVAK